MTKVIKKNILLTTHLPACAIIMYLENI